MKRRNPRKIARSDPGENGVGQNEEVDSSEEPQEKKGRKIKGRKSRGKPAETDSELETDQSEDVENEPSKENGNNQEKKGRKSKGKKSKQKPGEAESETENTEETDPLAEDDDAEYEVEAILDEKMVKGVRHYLIRWKGYTEESDTWEPEKTLDCDHLMQEYKERKKKEKNKPNNKKKGGKENKENPQGEDWDENQDFEVDRILDVYFHRDGSKDFLVSWKGYPASQNSWEPEDNMDCKDLIKKFMNKVNEAKQFESKETKLRVNPKPVSRLEFSMHERSRRLSKRRSGKDRVHYYDAE